MLQRCRRKVTYKRLAFLVFCVVGTSFVLVPRAKEHRMQAQGDFQNNARYDKALRPAASTLQGSDIQQLEENLLLGQDLVVLIANNAVDSGAQQNAAGVRAEDIDDLYLQGDTEEEGQQVFNSPQNPSKISASSREHLLPSHQDNRHEIPRPSMPSQNVLPAGNTSLDHEPKTERTHAYKMEQNLTKLAKEVEYVPPKLSPDFWLRNGTNFYFEFPINEPDKCKEYQVDILIITLSAPDNGHVREEGRRTWARRLRFRKYVLWPVFLLGETDNVTLSLSILEESMTYHDIIQANFTDSYHNLTYKTLSGLNWARNYCQTARFIYKVDDDSADVHRTELYFYLLKKDEEKIPVTRAMLCLYPGFEPPYNEPKRNSSNRWHVSENDYPDMFYPHMCMGSGGYLITMDVVPDIIDMSRRTRPLWLEDVYVTGILRTLVGNITIDVILKSKWRKRHQI